MKTYHIQVKDHPEYYLCIRNDGILCISTQSGLWSVEGGIIKTPVPISIPISIIIPKERLIVAYNEIPYTMEDGKIIIHSHMLNIFQNTLENLQEVGLYDKEDSTFETQWVINEVEESKPKE